MLSNEKYCGNVEIFKTSVFVEKDGFARKKGRKHNMDESERYLIVNNQQAIISKADFAAVQAEKSQRSNVEQTSDGVRRKATKHSSKKGGIRR
ncbi:MAG: recombinase family protein [Clostridiales bacterium]|jgi:hypothetical protein|nr:recombinase family protein [Clostridiales bacterium]